MHRVSRPAFLAEPGVLQPSVSHCPPEIASDRGLVFRFQPYYYYVNVSHLSLRSARRARALQQVWDDLLARTTLEATVVESFQNWLLPASGDEGR